MTTGLTRTDRPRQLDDPEQRKHNHQLDECMPDPSSLTPLCDEPEFATILQQMVADEAPRLFAVVQEYGERVDGRIAAWGMAFTDHTEVVSVEPKHRMSLQAPENALRLFTFGNHIRARLVWFTPDTATSTEDDETT
jgi:hypothetical protein